MSRFTAWFGRWVQSPTGPKTLHFWAPTANYFFVVQGLYDWNKNPATISKEMQMVLSIYSSMFMRWAWRITPRSYLLFTMHLCNFLLQGRLFIKRYSWELSNPELAKAQRERAQLQLQTVEAQVNEQKK